MGKSFNQKLKLLYIMQMLKENTDENHAMSANDIISALAKQGISAERKSIYDDIERLKLFGCDILSRRSEPKGYYLASRDFEIAELVALTGVMAALSLVAYLFFRIPFYGGSSFHLGNTFTALTALLLDGVSGGLAGAIGLALADILAGDPGYAITTFVLKFIIGITCGAVAHKVFKLRDQDRHSAGYLVKVIVSAGSGLLLNVFTDPFLGYFRNVYIFGQEYTVAQALTKIAGGVTFVNSVASTACAVVLYLALRPALERAKLLSKGENKAA